MPLNISFGGISSANVSSLTVPSGNPNTLLIVFNLQSRGVPVPPPSPISDLSFGGQAMTQVANFNAYQTGANETILQVWYLYNPPTGSSQNFTSVSGGGTVSVTYAAYYYNAISVYPTYQSTSGAGGSSPGSTSLFSNNNFQTNAWAFTVGLNGGTTSITSPTFSPTSRVNTSGNFWVDTNQTFSGIYEWDYTLPAFDLYGYLALFIIPYTPPYTSDQINISDTVTDLDLSKIFLTSTPDTITVSDSASIDNSALRMAINLVTSGYKWLTSTLLAAQQSFTVRPYSTVQVIDDTIQPNNEYFSGTGNPGGTNLNTSSATAPDGTVYSVGINNSTGHLTLYWSSQLNAVAGVWDNSMVIPTGSELINDPRNTPSIRISDWYQSSYQIDVWYFANFANDGTNLQIKKQVSLDRGHTWTETNFTPSNLPNNALGNVGLTAMDIVMGSDGNMYRGCFYMKLESGAYNIYYIYGSPAGYTTDVKWTKNVNSYDWQIHSIGSYRLNGTQYLVISGFRSILDGNSGNDNYSLWVTALLTNKQSNSLDLWMSPNPILPVGTASSTNLNSFTYPAATVITANNQTLVYITCQATLVDSTSATATGQNTVVISTHTNYMLLNSDDGKTFSYPTVMVGSDANATEFNNETFAPFVQQNNYYYLIGGGYLWEYLQSNLVADLSDDLIGWQIQEAAGQPSSITVNIANANNKWAGSSPTGQGAAALQRNRKIALWSGYYNANAVPEAVPRNIYYIDDVQTSVSGTTNDLTLVGRDWFKKLITTVTRFTYNFVGPLLFTDIFDGTYTSSWNQVAGTWEFVGNANPPYLSLQTQPGTITYVGSNQSTYGSIMRIFFQNQNPVSTSHVYFYAVYIDANDWLRLDIDTYSSTWTVTQSIAGSTTNLDSGSLPSALANNAAYGIFIRRYEYYKFNFMIDMYGAGVGNAIFDYDPDPATCVSYLFKNSGTGEFDMSSVFTGNASWQSPFTVGFGASGSGPNIFRWFMLANYYAPNNLGEVMRSLARISGIFSYKLTNSFRELFFTPSWTGSPNFVNRQLYLEEGSSAFSSSTFDNGEIQFQAKANVDSLNSAAGFSFVFRQANDQSGFNDYYKFHVIQSTTGFANPPTFCRFERYVEDINPPVGTNFVFYNTAYDVNDNPQSLGSVGVDITKWNTYRIVLIDGWFYAFVNDQMMAAWNDNNTSIPFQTTGTWGFQTDTNTTLYVENITAPNFWKPVQSFAFNPGDDANDSISSLFEVLRSWIFSDLFGRFKAIFASPTDTSTYTYNEQLYQQQTDESDKEYVAQVTVYGNGVSATARNTSLMAGVQTRDLVVVDYTITTQADAQTRADYELTNSNQYLAQLTPKQVINVGSELFDAVTVINTGNNTTDVDGPTRVYGQTINAGGGTNQYDYSIELQTGTL